MDCDGKLCNGHYSIPFTCPLFRKLILCLNPKAAGDLGDADFPAGIWRGEGYLSLGFFVFLFFLFFFLLRIDRD